MQLVRRSDAASATTSFISAFRTDFLRLGEPRNVALIIASQVICQTMRIDRQQLRSFQPIVGLPRFSVLCDIFAQPPSVKRLHAHRLPAAQSDQPPNTRIALSRNAHMAAQSTML